MVMIIIMLTVLLANSPCNNENGSHHKASYESTIHDLVVTHEKISAVYTSHFTLFKFHTQVTLLF